jgi:NADH:ubiquinone oxidoreductase subunit K
MINEGIGLSQSLFGDYFVVAAMLILTGFYCIWTTHNLVRVLIGVELMTKGVTLILAAAGFLTGNTGTSQSFIIVLIVMEVVILVAAAGVVIGHYRKSGNLDARQMNNLKG